MPLHDDNRVTTLNRVGLLIYEHLCAPFPQDMRSWKSAKENRGSGDMLTPSVALFFRTNSRRGFPDHWFVLF